MYLRSGLSVLALSGVLVLGVACVKKTESMPPPKQTGATPPPRIVIQHETLPSVLIGATAGEVHKPMQIFTDPDAVGGKFVVGPIGPNHTHHVSIGGDVTFKLSVAKSGQYKLWFRTHWCCACGKSLDVILDGADLGTAEDMVFQKWHWVPLRQTTPTLDAGEHLLVVRSRQDGSAFDQVLLTQDLDYHPTGVELPDAPERTVGTVAVAAPSPSPKQP